MVVVVVGGTVVVVVVVGGTVVVVVEVVVATVVVATVVVVVVSPPPFELNAPVCHKMIMRIPTATIATTAMRSAVILAFLQHIFLSSCFDFTLKVCADVSNRSVLSTRISIDSPRCMTLSMDSIMTDLALLTSPFTLWILSASGS